MENIGEIIAGVVLFCCLIFGGLYMILSKETAEKAMLDERTGIPYYRFVNKTLGWILLLSGIFILVASIIMVLVCSGAK